MTSTEAYTKLGQDMQLANYRPSTMKAYQRCVERLLAHFGGQRPSLGEEFILGPFLHLINEKKAGAEKCKACTRQRLRLLSSKTMLGRPEEVVRMPSPEGSRAAPGHLERQEVEKLLLTRIIHRSIVPSLWRRMRRDCESGKGARCKRAISTASGFSSTSAMASEAATGT